MLFATIRITTYPSVLRLLRGSFGCELMLRWLQGRVAAFSLAWADAQALIDCQGDMGEWAAILRVPDPRELECPRSSRHWRLVARIVAWRTGDDDRED